MSQLQVPDEAFSLLMGMGYKERAAKRALRMSNQDIQSAIDLLEEERERKIRRRQENLLRQAEIMLAIFKYILTKSLFFLFK